MITITDFHSQCIYIWENSTLKIETLTGEQLYLIKGCISFRQAINFYRDVVRP